MMVVALLGMIVAGFVTWRQEERWRRMMYGSCLKQVGYALHLYVQDTAQPVGRGGSDGAAPDAPRGE